MPINYRTETGISQGINSFDLQQSTSTLSNDNSTQTFISFLQSSSRFIEQIAANYSSLRAGINEGGLAFVEASQGTQWLPYTVGGTYYPKGWYVWDSGQWISSKSNIAETLDAIGSGGGGGGSSFSGDYNDLTNKPTIPVDTTLSDGDIAALGYIKTFTDNNTQLSDSDIAALGYIKTFTDTQLSDADITALGYVKTDNNTQLSDAEITALGYIKTFTNTQLSDADITALGYVKTDNNTQLSDSDIAALGYVKTDNDTQLSDADITALGYIKTDNNTQRTDSEIDARIALNPEGFVSTDNNTQLSDSDIAAMGYVKTDNNTQLSDAEITALGYVKTSGKDISFFQVQDDGVTGQLVIAGYFDAVNFWDTPTLTDADFTFNSTLGHLTVNKAGIIEIDAKLVTYNALNNRHELYIELQKNGVSLVADSQYASRNNNQRVGGAYISGFKDTAAIGDIYKLRTKRTGVNATIGINTAAKMSYLSAKLYS